MKRFVSVLIMVIVLIVNMTSCVQSIPPKKPADQNEIHKDLIDDIDPDDSKITIKIAANISEKLFDKFLEDHPDVKIITYNSLNTQDMGDIEKLQQMHELFSIRGKEPPDIFYLMFTSSGLEFALSDIEYAEPLDKYIETSSGFYNRFLPGSLEAAKFAGQTYVLPLGWDIGYLHYNRDIFDTLAVNYPSDDWNVDDFNRYYYGSHQDKRRKS